MMRRDPISADCTPDRPHRLGVFMATAISLLLILAPIAEVWALSSGGRYGGRAGFTQSRRGFVGSGGGGSTIPSRPYVGRAPGGRPTLNYPVPVPSPGYPLPIPVPIPMSSPGFGTSPSALPPSGWSGGGGGGSGLGGVFG